MFKVYALYNSKYHKIYIGQTGNIDERLRLHKHKTFKKSFTAKLDGEWTLIYSENIDNREKAIVREKQLKSYKGREFIKTHIPR